MHPSGFKGPRSIRRCSSHHSFSRRHLTKSKRRSGTLRANQVRQTYAQKGQMAGRPDYQCIAAAGSLLRPHRAVQPINNVSDGSVKRAEFRSPARTGDEDRHSNKGKSEYRKFLSMVGIPRGAQECGAQRKAAPTRPAVRPLLSLPATVCFVS